MAFKNSSYRFLLILMAVFIVFFASFVHSSSRTSLQIQVAEHHTSKTTQDAENNVINSLRKGGASAIFVEDSAREVPTGPDPLHHNGNPTRP